ncbi:MAG: hypothetical protein R3B93_03190 [Bacteroidia bacterium]
MQTDEDLAGYKIYWRETTAPQWQHSRFVGKVGEYTLEGIVIDNYLFGVAAVGKDGNESVSGFSGWVDFSKLKPWSFLFNKDNYSYSHQWQCDNTSF